MQRLGAGVRPPVLVNSPGQLPIILGRIKWLIDCNFYDAKSVCLFVSKWSFLNSQRKPGCLVSSNNDDSPVLKTLRCVCPTRFLILSVMVSRLRSAE